MQTNAGVKLRLVLSGWGVLSRTENPRGHLGAPDTGWHTRACREAPSRPPPRPSASAPRGPAATSAAPAPTEAPAGPSPPHPSSPVQSAITRLGLFPVKFVPTATGPHLRSLASLPGVPALSPAACPGHPGPRPEPQTRIHLHGLCACRTGLNPPLPVPTSPGSPVSPWLPEGACGRGRSLFCLRPSKAPRSSPVPRTPCDLPCHLPDLAISSYFPHPTQGPHSSSSTQDVVLSQGLCTCFTQEPVRSSPALPKYHDLAPPPSLHLRAPPQPSPFPPAPLLTQSTAGHP